MFDTELFILEVFKEESIWNISKFVKKDIYAMHNMILIYFYILYELLHRVKRIS